MTSKIQANVSKFSAMCMAHIMGSQFEPPAIDEHGHTLELVSMSGKVTTALVLVVFCTITDEIPADSVQQHTTETHKALGSMAGSWGVMTTMVAATTLKNTTKSAVEVTTQGTLTMLVTPQTNTNTVLGDFDDDEPQDMPQLAHVA